MSVDVRNLDVLMAHQQQQQQQRAAETTKTVTVGRQAWHIAVGCDDGHVLIYALRPKQKKSEASGTGGRFNLMRPMSAALDRDFEWEFVKLQEITVHETPIYDISIAHSALLSVGMSSCSGPMIFPRPSVRRAPITLTRQGEGVVVAGRCEAARGRWRRGVCAGGRIQRAAAHRATHSE